MKSIAVIDYGMGNLHSVAKALEHVCPDTRVHVTNDAAKIEACDRVLLPGVGAIRDCMAEIKRLGVDQIVAQQMGKKPMLGICVGMQALMQHSTENSGVDCLGELPGEVSFFGDQPSVQQMHLKVPHMGWSQVQQRPHKLWDGIEDNSRFYFVHSYYVRTQKRELVAATCDYGLQFDVALADENIFAVQFHPEKSHTAG
ncbi:MAG: imidazole glycerol phosphate synthase subunit HisH, partial [Oceanospirillaceae bacterium]|nr:imidazole glycerol phosphate synthase subunit HisH [Oceanospirillaceae bacterium]